MSWTRRLAGAGLAVLLLFQGSLAAKRDDWTNLNSLKPGDRIRILRSNQQRIEGTFQAATESGISIRADREITLSRAEVVRVDRHSASRRLTRTLIGAGIGIVVGVIINGTLGERLKNEGSDVSSGAWIAGSAGIGAGIGALASGSYQTIYRSPRS